ncbi:2-oxoacid:acceptor oxidoreductase family protein [Moorella sp. Hama-1]|uniref:2-oxoacid:acceptor oxidoreductase family protein n=1 Tax=Moorella sp. Hama-1 TaxID=2138101 RepID=UPI000D65240A|nr:2-oxoacid:acceptor oxidoreductase family protein [Moorella sp. Hama-1]BCV22850.1 2-oxoglutarate ferredoxin oxidoreductase subunit gamma [Moorella sp. Hama-1]
MARTEVLVSGFGGQGVVRIGQTLSTAAVYQDLKTTMLVSHGTETRGGYVRTQVVISPETIDSPVVENPDYFVALSKAAYNRFIHLAKKGLVIYDPAYVEPDSSLTVKHIPLAARDTAERELGRELYANAIVLGAMAKMMTGLVDKENILKAMLERIPRFHEENKKAFEIGYSLISKE